MPKLLPRAKVPELIRLLKTRYGQVKCALDHENAFQLTVATILSAQTTDKRVNMVTPALFAKYPTVQDLARADLADVEELVHTTGFFRNKAKNIVGMAKAVVEKYGGEIPRTMDELLELPGVARKTANVVLGNIFAVADGVVVDTHVLRLSQLLGLTRHDEPVKVERDLMKLLPQDEWILFSHMLIHHGREICIANRPKCGECMLNKLCPSAFAAQGRVGKLATAKAERGLAKTKKLSLRARH
jgi:endonuclease III